jgi:hypothetical protein
MKVCVIVEGQLRGAVTSGPTFKKYLVDELNADLYFYLQNFSDHKDENLNYYGENKGVVVYSNPEPNFTSTFNNLCDRYNYDKNNWNIFFNRVRDENYKLGFQKPGTCIRRMYNRYLIYEYLKDKDYDWFIISRSDMCFVDPLVTVSNLEQMSHNKLYAYKQGAYNGVNNNLIVFHKDIFNEICNYIHLFLSGKLLNFMLNIARNRTFGLNEEKFFYNCLRAQNINIEYLSIKSYICGDSLKEVTTWVKIRHDPKMNKYYKYEYDYRPCLEYLNKI